MSGAALQLTIDARKAFDTGIGTYIRQVLPRVLRAWPQARARVLVRRGSSAQHAYLDGCGAALVELDAAPFSLAEQWVLRPLALSADLFWATSLAHPLYPRGRMVNTVYDLAQLALPRAWGGSLTQRVLARPFFDSIRRRACQTLFISDFTASEFRRLVGEPAGASEVIPLGVDEAWFLPPAEAAAKLPDGPLFVMLGNLRPHKNLVLALQALALVSQSASHALPHQLLLIGPDDPARLPDPAIQALLKQLGPRVRWAGPLPQAELTATLRQAEALVFPSHYEGCGLPVLEAMACGCPVLVARNGISPQLAGELALNFDPNDPASLAAAMQAQAGLAAADRSRQTHAGRLRARSHSWELTAERTVAALQSAGRQARTRRTRALAA